MYHKLFRSKYIDQVAFYQSTFPVVAILGPRQCGKSTIAKDIAKTIPNSEWFDLENFEHLNYINNNHLAFFRANENKVLFLDEIQKLPEIFRTMRGVLDKDRRNGSIFILGSASANLLKQSSESLTGRIRYINLTPFHILELEARAVERHWLRGGFPLSYLANTDDQSFLWRENYIKNIIEKDIREFKDWNIDYLDSGDIFKLFQLLAHYHGHPLIYAKIGSALNKKDKIIQKYISLLEQMYLIRILQPYVKNNTKKRLVKTPKIYIRDSGILHAIARIKNVNELIQNPYYGFSFEGYVIENLATIFGDARLSYYLTNKDQEIDVILEQNNKIIAIEVKTSKVPKLTNKGICAIKEVRPDHTFIIVPSYESPLTLSYDYGQVTICDLPQAINEIENIL